MTEAERAPYLERAVVRFADDLAAAFDWDRDDALAKSRRHVDGVLTEPGHHFRHIVQDGARVGVLWFAEQEAGLYIYDIAVDAGHRGQGAGTAALRSLEREARRLGAPEIKLSVFAHNTTAIRLYERLGYQPCETGKAGMRMVKPIK